MTMSHEESPGPRIQKDHRGQRCQCQPWHVRLDEKGAREREGEIRHVMTVISVLWSGLDGNESL